MKYSDCVEILSIVLFEGLRRPIQLTFSLIHPPTLNVPHPDKCLKESEFSPRAPAQLRSKDECFAHVCHISEYFHEVAS